MRGVLILALALVACGPPEPVGAQAELSWSDGDSGFLVVCSPNGLRREGAAPSMERAQGCHRVAFRLADVDAPETGPVGWSGGAKCEAEREAGAVARRYMVAISQDSAARLRPLYEDGFGRSVAELELVAPDGVSWVSVSEMGLAAGVLRPWPHDETGKALASKPDWCGDLDG